MSGSNNSQKKEVSLPAVVTDPAVPASANNKTVLAGMCTALAPLALEVIYGLTRKWLTTMVTNSSKPAGTSSSRTDDRLATGGRLRQRRRSKRAYYERSKP